VWIHNDNYSQRVPKPLVLVKIVGKGRTNTAWRVNVLNRLFDKSNKPSQGAFGS